MKTQLLKPMCALLLAVIMSSQAYAAVTTMTVKGDNVKINTAADGSGTSITVPAGTSVQVMGKKGNDARIVVDGQIYYIPATALQASQTETVAAAEVKPAAVAGKKMIVNGDNIRLRAQPQTGDNILGEYNTGKEVEVFEKSGDWVRVKVDGREGFMNHDFLMTKEAFAAKPAKTVEGCTKSLNPKDPSNQNAEGRAVVAALQKYAGLGSLSELMNTTWTATDSVSKGTVFQITGTGAFHLRILDLPQKSWSELTAKAKADAGLFSFMASEDAVKGKVREGDFTGRLCLVGQGSEAVITVSLDGAINGEARRAAITIIPSGKKQYKVIGTFAGENLNGTFSVK